MMTGGSTGPWVTVMTHICVHAFKIFREAFSISPRPRGNCDDRGKWSGRGMTGADD